MDAAPVPATAQRPPPDASSEVPSHSMLGMRLDYLDVGTFVSRFVDLSAHGSHYACVPDVHQCMLCHESPSHRAIVNGADFVMSDSTVMQRARALRHGVTPLRTELGQRLMLLICEEAARRGVPIGLVGGRDVGALATLEAALREQVPGLDIAYGYAPPFRPLTQGEEREMLGGLAGAGARIVFFGIGCPKQEEWMARYKAGVEGGRIAGSMIGVGAAFDTLSGAVPTAPPWVHRAGLEWAVRLAREPRRLWRRYAHAAPRFLWLLARERMRAGRPGPAAGRP